MGIFDKIQRLIKDKKENKKGGSDKDRTNLEKLSSDFQDSATNSDPVVENPEPVGDLDIEENNSKLDDGLKRTRDNFFGKLARTVAGKSKIDENLLDDIEEALITSDIGVDTTLKIIESLEQRVEREKYINTSELNNFLKQEISLLVKDCNNKIEEIDTPYVIMVVGVNGVGKTTTIGKIGKKFLSNENKVLFSACDTFRAAAIEQLEQWANRIKVDIIKSAAGSDPASVAYKAIEYSKNNKINTLLIDTAGRLQNKKNLMDEYKKIGNVLKKHDQNAPNEVILILDATSGQNIISQVEEFNKIFSLTGIIMTKLDGTAKGGILIALSKKYKLPIIGLGLGEKEDDFESFDAEKFAHAFIQKN